MVEARWQNKKRRAFGVFGSSLRMLLASLLAVSFAVCAALPAQAATKVTTTLSDRDGYGRIVLNWPSAVPKHNLSVSAGVLVVKFDTPFSVDVDEFLRQMPQVVALARQDADGKSLRLGLKNDYWLNVREVENSLYVDLLPSTWSGEPPALPAAVIARVNAIAEAKAKAAAAEQRARDLGIVEPESPSPDLSVRVARHDGMTRLVFDWNQPVLYSLAQQDGLATITFDRSAKVSLAQIRVNPPPFLKTITATEREGRLSVFLKIDSGVVVSDFREDLGVVLDLKPHIANVQSVEPSVAKVADEQSTSPEINTHPEEATADRNEEAVVDETHVTPRAHAPKAISPKVATSENHPVEEKVDQVVAEVDHVKPDEAVTPEIAHHEPPTPEAEAASPNEASAPQSILPKSAEVVRSTESDVGPPVDEEMHTTVDALPGMLMVSGHATDNRSEITFPWTEPTGAAVFLRSDMLWIVFDREAQIDASSLQHLNLKGFGPPITVNHAGATILAFPLTQAELFVGVVEQGTTWRVSLAHSLASTGRSIELQRNWSATGEGYVSAELVGARKILKIEDPLVGDTLLVATARGNTQSLQAARSFIEFKALKSAQGLAIVRIADNLNVAAAPDAVIISRHNGLVLSADNDNGSRASDSMVMGVSPAAMDLAAWRGKGRYLPQQQMLMNRAAMAAPTDEAAARLDYARFFMGNGLAQEALTQLGLALKADFKLEGDTTFRAMRGVANVMAHRNSEAVDDLSISALELDPYAAGWRGLARVELGELDRAAKDFDFAGGLIEEMDTESSQRMHLSAAEAALAMNDLSSAHIHLGALPGILYNDDFQARSYVLRARLLEGLKKPQEALNFYDRAIEIGGREQLVRARLGKALALSEAGKLNDEEMILELNRLRTMWRGGDLERTILTVLAKKELASGKIVDALGAMRAATRYFPHNDEAQALGAKMPEIFADYFIGAGAKELSAVQALAFYYEFQDLTPIGQKGDELIRNLAERLVSIDLLEQAAVLLRYQVEQRLYGSVAKAQVAARLASVYLLDDKPKEALKVIRSTMQNQLPPDLRHKRQLLEARALASLKQYELALDLLSEIETDQAEELRAEVYWESQSWDAAGQTNEAMAQAALKGISPDVALSDDVRFKIMRSAIAYSMGGNSSGLARLRSQFGDRMASSVDASAFAVVSDPIEVSGVAFRQLASRVASVNMIEKFVSSLKDDALAQAPKPAKAAELEADSNSAVN